MKFYCNCDFHFIDIDKRPLKFQKTKLDYIGMTIYEHRSGNTGKLFKKPKELGTVTLIGNEPKKFIKYINKTNVS